MSTTSPAPESAAPARPKPSSDASSETMDKHSVKDQHNPLRRSRSNPIAAVDPATQFPHAGFDADDATDLENGAVGSEKEDANIVDFDGPNDPQKAVNWSRKHKFSMLGLISVMTFITYAHNILLKNCITADKGHTPDHSHHPCLPQAYPRCCETSAPLTIHSAPSLSPSTF